MIQRICAIAILLSFLSAQPKAQHNGIPDKDFNAYLFTYFIGNSENAEAVRYAVSLDGYQYFTLNNNEPILDSKKISEAGGIRDPHILRKEDGHSFYMVGTDMMSSKGWDSNRGMVLMKSDDLVHWESSAVNIQKRFQGHEDLKRVWAPQTIYDNKEGKYLIYFSMKHGNGPDIIYYAYANKDFTDLEDNPKPFFIPETKLPSIDGDIVYKDSLYYLFYKTETDNPGIKMAMTKDLTSNEWIEYDKYLQQTEKSVEGSGIF
jgi:beta-xylosidase